MSADLTPAGVIEEAARTINRDAFEMDPWEYQEDYCNYTGNAHEFQARARESALQRAREAAPVIARWARRQALQDARAAVERRVDQRAEGVASYVNAGLRNGLDAVDALLAETKEQ